MNKFFGAIGLQFCGIVGAGIFALPYIFNLDFGLATTMLAVAGILMFILNSFYITIINKTKGDHQLSGYAQIYLGRFGKILSLFSLGFLCWGAILAYVKLSATFLNISFPSLPIFSGAVFFIILVTFLHLIKFKLGKTVVQYLPVINLLIILVIFLAALKYGPFDFGVFWEGQVVPHLYNFYGWGAIVFALSGFTIIPEMEEILRQVRNKKILLKLTSLIGLVLAMIVYLAFSYAVIVISGRDVSMDAITGVLKQNYLFGYMLIFFGLNTVLTASLNLMLILKEMFYQDLKIKNKAAYLISIIFLISTLLFINIPFIEIISVVGTVSTILSAVIICWIRARI